MESYKVWIEVFICSGYIPRNGISGSYGNFMFKLWRSYHCFPMWLHCFIFPPAVYKHANFSTLTNTCYCLFDYSHPSGSEVIAHWDFDLSFS